MSRQGQAIFADRVALFAQQVNDSRVGAVARQVGAGVTVAVHGRPGVGRGTVARALAANGVMTGDDADVDVHVIAEVVKPEDRAAIAASASVRPTLVVLNRADLLGASRARCAVFAALTGAVTVPLVAHLAVVDVDHGSLAALRALAAERSEEPLAAGSVDDFVSKPHPLSADTRTRLVETLDSYGIRQAVLALRAGADDAGVLRVLRRRSGVRAVVAALAPMVAEAGYQRVRHAITSLEMIAATSDDGIEAEVAAFLRDDDTVLACMAAAVDAVEAAGIAVDPSDEPAAHLCRAAQWRTYQRGPVNAVHGACGAAIVRGSLRLWRRTQTRVDT